MTEPGGPLYVVSRAHGLYRTGPNGKNVLVYDANTFPDELVIVNTRLLESGYNIKTPEGRDVDIRNFRIEYSELHKYIDVYNHTRASVTTFLPGNDRPPRVTSLFAMVRDTLKVGMVRFPETVRQCCWIDSIRGAIVRAGMTPPRKDRISEMMRTFRQSHPLVHIDDTHFVDTIEMIEVIRLDFASLCRGQIDPRPGDIKIMLNSGHHAREWLSQTCLLQTVQLLMYEFTRLSLSTMKVRATHPLSGYIFTIIPIVNFSSFLSTVSVSKPRLIITSQFARSMGPFMDRQKRTLGDNSPDPNRNYDCVHGMLRGTSRDPATETFCGPFPESAIETRCMAMLLRHPMYRSDIGCDMHSYGNIVLTFPSWNLARCTHELLTCMHKPRGTVPDFDSTASEAHTYPVIFDNYKSTAAIDSVPGGREFLLAMAETPITVDTPRKNVIAAEVAFLALYFYGAQAVLHDKVTDRFIQTFTQFGKDSTAALGYEATGTASDYYAKLGMVLCGMEIGSKRSQFAKGGFEGLADQMDFASNFYEFLISADIKALVQDARNLQTSDTGSLPRDLIMKWQTNSRAPEESPRGAMGSLY